MQINETRDLSARKKETKSLRGLVSRALAILKVSLDLINILYDYIDLISPLHWHCYMATIEDEQIKMLI